MDKALAEMNSKELFCALTGEYGPIRQAYVQTAFRKYKEQHGEYAELTEMIRAAVSGWEEKSWLTAVLCAPPPPAALWSFSKDMAIAHGFLPAAFRNS